MKEGMYQISIWLMNGNDNDSRQIATIEMKNILDCIELVEYIENIFLLKNDEYYVYSINMVL